MEEQFHFASFKASATNNWGGGGGGLVEITHLLFWLLSGCCNQKVDYFLGDIMHYLNPELVLFMYTPQPRGGGFSPDFFCRIWKFHPCAYRCFNHLIKKPWVKIHYQSNTLGQMWIRVLKESFCHLSEMYHFRKKRFRMQKSMFFLSLFFLFDWIRPIWRIIRIWICKRHK